MRDVKIVVRQVNQNLVTVARTAPIQETVIVKLRGGVLETVSKLKLKETDLLGTVPTVPRVAPEVNYY